MLGDGLRNFGSVLETSYAYESDRRLREELEKQWEKEAAVEELGKATSITEQDVLVELVNCGVRADSLHVVTLVPTVHVAWSNGYVDRKERLAIVKLATEQGMAPDSKAFALLNSWLSKKPNPELFVTWKDYIGAVGRIVSEESFAALRESTVSSARSVAEAARGLFTMSRLSAEEVAAINELDAAFDL